MSQVLRLSYLKPHFVSIGEVEKLLDELMETLAHLPGFVMGLRFGVYGDPQSNEIGRLTIWADHTVADRAARNEHVLALRSRINTLLHEDPEEHLLEVRGAAVNLPKPQSSR